MMKKILLFIFALAIMGSSIAQKAARQNAVPQERQTTFVKNLVEKETSTAETFPSTLYQRESMGNKILSSYLIGSARNIYGGLLVYQNCLTYNKELDNILFTHRGNDKGTIALLGNGNDIITAFSPNHGASFSQKIAMTNGLANRYPSGVFYNPAGNSDTANAYTLVVGPLNTNSIWDKNYYHSGKYDGTGQDHLEVATDPTYLELIRNGLTATSDDKFHVSGLGSTDDGTYYTSVKIYDMNGTWNSTSNKVDWAAKGEITPNIFARPSTNGIYIDGAFSKAAWSPDGSVGYLMMIGSDNRPSSKPSYVPIVWKSVNGGTTWTLLDYFDWGSLSAIQYGIFPINTDTTVYKPMFEEASMVVDANNKPHIFGLVRGCYSSDPDSLGYVYVRSSTQTIMDGNIVEMYLDESNVWQGNWIDSISADAVSAAKSPYVSSPDNIGWDHRLTASISDDRTNVFCSWTDSDWIFWGTEAYDFNPDLKVWRRDLNSVNPPLAPVNITAGTDYWGLVFFHYTSQEVIKDTDTTYQLPLVIADINTSGMQADEPVYYNFIGGVEITTGVNNHPAENSVRASACYPNPFTGTAKVDVVMAKSANVAISIFDITGRTVSSTNYGTLAAGKNTLTIDGTKLHSGVYFYTITVGDQKYNSKMIVK